MHLPLRTLFYLAVPLSAYTPPFNPIEVTIPQIHTALFTGLTSCTDVVRAHLARIEALNPTINAVLSLSPKALIDAAVLDAQLPTTNATPPLFCIPILLKDNYDAAGLVTTAGCAALKDVRPEADAPVVAALRAAGAVILGKANLHELALEGLTVSSAGGQTRNPYDLTRTPGGSSGGSGAALAASLAVLATGTDTVNSLRSPASANSLVSVRPTRGLITRTGVVPISWTQDAVGPMGRNLEDVAVMLNVMARVGFEAKDNVTGLVPEGLRGVDYVSNIKGGALSGLRVGMVEGFFNRTASEETTPVNDAMAGVVEMLKTAGAVVVNITGEVYNATRISAELDTQRFEYREMLSSYLESPGLGGEHPRSMPEIYTGDEFLVIPSQYEYVTTALVSSTANASYGTVQGGVRNLTLALADTFAGHDLDALMYPEQKNLVVKVGAASQSGRNGILAALTGSPVVTVPVGFSGTSANAARGVPIGMEILGRPWTESKLLQIAYQVERRLRARRPPAVAEVEVSYADLSAVPSITRRAEDSVPSVYPIGHL